MSNPNDPVFPVNFDMPNGKQYAGLTKRELFAAVAMHAGILKAKDGTVPATTAAYASAMADTMLAELEATKDRPAKLVAQWCKMEDNPK